MKWLFLLLACMACLTGSLLSWEDYQRRRGVEAAHTSPDGSMSFIHYDSGWVHPTAIGLSLGISAIGCLGFLKLHQRELNSSYADNLAHTSYHD